MKRFWRAIGFILCILVLSVNTMSASSSIDMEKVKAKIDPLIASKEFTYDIVKVSDPVDNFVAVFIHPSFRDFPNVILFQLDQNSSDYVRIYEGLSLGIQDKPSGKTDLHTLGLGIDMQSDGGSNAFESESIRKMFELGNQSNFDVIPYQGFIHMQLAGNECYTIDKTKYRDFALSLIGDAYEKYPKDSCVMFDTPDLVDPQFVHENGKYVITSKTDNNQFWTVTFEGVDQENRYLVNKIIEVKKSQI